MTQFGAVPTRIKRAVTFALDRWQAEASGDEERIIAATVLHSLALASLDWDDRDRYAEVLSTVLADRQGALAASR